MSPAALYGHQVTERAEPIRVMTFNIRFDSPTDGANRWRHRRDFVAELIAGQADLAGLQEARRCPLGWLNRHLRGFRWVGVGRANGRRRGEYSPIFFRTARFRSLDRGTFWLSSRPDEPGSRSWGSSVARIATWVRLRDRTTGQDLVMVNTHLDHRSAEARAEGAKLIARRLTDLAGDLPVIVTGDFNDGPGGDAHRLLTDDFGLVDARQASASGHAGPDSTWTGFKAVKAGRVIDFILTSPQITVTSHRSLEAVRDGRFASDHLPVVAVVEL